MNCFEAEMIKTGIEAIGEFCNIFRSNLGKDTTLHVVDLIESKSNLSINLYSAMEIEGITDYSIYALG
jgi:hypothetical protein